MMMMRSFLFKPLRHGGHQEVGHVEFGQSAVQDILQGKFNMN